MSPKLNSLFNYPLEYSLFSVFFLPYYPSSLLYFVCLLHNRWVYKNRKVMCLLYAWPDENLLSQTCCHTPCSTNKISPPIKVMLHNRQRCCRLTRSDSRSLPWCRKISQRRCLFLLTRSWRRFRFTGSWGS